MTSPAPHLAGFIRIIAAEIARQIEAEQREALAKQREATTEKTQESADQAAA